MNVLTLWILKFRFLLFSNLIYNLHTRFIARLEEIIHEWKLDEGSRRPSFVQVLIILIKMFQYFIVDFIFSSCIKCVLRWSVL